ncbi:MAG: copper homeostasis protein CutC [Planctomycetota bacterium]
MTQILVEVCVDSLAGAQAALEAGAHRLELCCELSVGGLTPGAGLVHEVVALGLPTIVLIRPRAGDFLFDAADWRVMTRDVAWVRQAGAAGVAIGGLTARGGVPVEELRGSLAGLDGGEACFHRAFDGLADPEGALGLLAELGFQRILSSGGSCDALAGSTHLARWKAEAPPGLEFMPGGGIRPENVAEVLGRTGARSVHFSARRPCPPAMEHLNPAVDLHQRAAHARSSTSRNEIERYLAAITAAGYHLA